MDNQTLYTINTNGKVKIWTICVKGTKDIAQIIINTGLENGKMTIFTSEINKGKNIGKANETTPLEQAISEAKSKYNKKLDAGYTKTKQKTTSDNNIILPMLALKYQEAGHRIKFPCYVQPKIDGLRGVLQKKELYSRLKNKFSNLDHILHEIQDCEYMLDGEIYSELGKGKETQREKGQETILTFQQINGLVKKKTLNEQDKKDMLNMVYIVYDFIPHANEIKKLTFHERYAILNDYFSKKKFKYIKLLQTHIAKDKDELIKYQKKFIKDGYEGLIIRNFDGLYKIKNRSADLQKFKDFQDSEFKIIGFTEGDNSTEKGCIIWICQTKDGKEFNVRPKGTFEERRKLYKDGKKYIGGMLTVMYFDHTDDGIPFHTSTMYGGLADIRSLQI
jgi:DNA ligase 1